MTRNDERFWGETRPRKQLAAIEGFAPGEVSCKVCGLQFVLDEKTLRNQVCKCLLGTREPLCLPLVSNEERPEIADNDSLKIETDYRVHSILTGVEAQSLAAGIGRGGTGNPGRRYASVDGGWPRDIFESDHIDMESGWCYSDDRESLLTWDRISVGNFDHCEGYAGGCVYRFTPGGVVIGDVSLYW